MVDSNVGGGNQRPSKLLETLHECGDIPFVARAGNGIIYHHGGGVAGHPPPGDQRLERRLKAAFDPQHLLPELYV